MLVLAFNKAAVKGTTTVPGFGKGAAVVFEIVLTAIFVLVILQVTKSGVFGSSALIAIPLTLVAIHIAAIPVSGASVNPARTLAPALIGNKWNAEWIYFLGPAAGAILGWLVHTIVVEGDFDLRDNVAAVAGEVEGEIDGGGAAVSDDQPDRLHPSGVQRRTPSRTRIAGGSGGAGEHRLDPRRLHVQRVSGRGLACRRRWAAVAQPLPSSAATSASSSSGSTSTPAPAATNSGGPPTRVATTERPDAMRLERREAERLGEARLADDIGGCDPAGDPVVIDRADEPDPGPALERAAQRAVADERERSLSSPLERAGEPQHVLALAQRADAEEPGSVRRPADLGAGLRRRAARSARGRRRSRSPALFPRVGHRRSSRGRAARPRRRRRPRARAGR